MDRSLTRSLGAARRGDSAAAAAFVRRSQVDVWRLCSHLVDAQSADDLTQETYLRAFRAMPAFRGESSARTWLLAIARRVCKDELRVRSRRRRRDHLLAGDPGEPLADLDPAEPVGVRSLLRQLEPDRRVAFVLTQFLALSYAEAAQVCGCPVGTIRSRVARARIDLVDLLTDERQRQEA